DFVDGLLSARETAVVSAHLAGCPLCREEERRLRMLVTDLAALPLSIEPPRDLGPSIRTRIAAVPPTGTARRLGDRPLRSLRWPLAAAAATLVAVTAA
ncbi:MAG: hypothetical protein GWO02_21075, partial [Gammaproteobacteria bacterium]|nr:hypothetical protein [Gammaproteobacteria bacterium]